jgi:outer membrane murein-binding lipoprotein Lpp
VKEQFSVLSKQFTNILDQASSQSTTVDSEIAELKQDTEEVDSTPIVEETMFLSSVKEQKSGMVGKLKNMFGKAKKKPIQVIPEVSDIRHIIVENQSAPSELESLILTTDKNQVSSESTEIEAEITELNQDIEEVESISIVEETILVKSAKEQKSGVVGKLKNMFGKAKKKPIVVVPEVLESKDISVESDQESPEAEQRSAFAASGWK